MLVFRQYVDNRIDCKMTVGKKQEHNVVSEIYQAFESLDIRVGRVLQAELNPKARKPSYRMEIDFGELGVRTSSGQYVANYSADDMVGQLVVCIMNLGSRRIAGVESQVLVLGVPDAQGETVLLTAQREVSLGAKVF